MTTININMNLTGNLLNTFSIDGAVEARGERLEQATVLAVAVNKILDNLELSMDDFAELCQIIETCPCEGVILDKRAISNGLGREET
ncbi:MAG: hypothetical protein LUC47_07735 [Clostridiales bacterium]|nr:hypothetical protein [Clostridiales bacterium]